MSFDELDAKMRVFETAHDHCVLPEIHMVARLDGRSFTRLTKERHEFARPFDERFRDLMIETTRHLVEDVGMRTVYGYTVSDEISILVHRDETSFGRNLRKLNSVLAGEASAMFTHRLGAPAAFDCRICQLPSTALVIDYFRWRQEDAHRNALGAHCYWLLREQGHNARAATRMIEGKSVADKNELLFRAGTNFNDLPAWQKRGVGLRWETFEKPGVDPRTGTVTATARRRVAPILELPTGPEYAGFIAGLLEAS